MYLLQKHGVSFSIDIDSWAHLDYAELRTIDNLVTTIAFWPIVTLFAIIGVILYPILILIRFKTLKDYFEFVLSAFQNTYQVPMLIIENTIKAGWNILYFLYLVNI